MRYFVVSTTIKGCVRVAKVGVGAVADQFLEALIYGVLILTGRDHAGQLVTVRTRTADGFVFGLGDSEYRVEPIG